MTHPLVELKEADAEGIHRVGQAGPVLRLELNGEKHVAHLLQLRGCEIGKRVVADHTEAGVYGKLGFAPDHVEAA